MIALDELKGLDGVNGQVDIVIPDGDAPVDELVAVDNQLQKFVGWGLNPKGLRASDFDFQFYVGTWSVVPGFGRPFHVYFAAKSKGTGKGQGGFGTAPYVRSHFATALRLVELAKEV